MKIFLFSFLIGIILICSNPQKKTKIMNRKGHNSVTKKARNLAKNETKTIVGEKAKTNSTKKNKGIFSAENLDTLLKTAEEEPHAVLLGFDRYHVEDYDRDNLKTLFFLHLYSNKTEINNNQYITLVAHINHTDGKVDDQEIECTHTSKRGHTATYECEYMNSDIRSLEIYNAMIIDKVGNVTIPHTSYADYQLKEGIYKFTGRHLNNLTDDHECFLNNTKIVTSSPNSFTAQGNLTNEKYLDVKNMKLFLINDGKGINATCNTKKDLQKDSNCELYCTLGKTFDTDLNMTLGFMPNDEYLLVDFDKNENSIVNHTNDPTGHQYSSKKKNGLSTGGIIAIIIPCVLVLLGVTALAFAYKRNTPPTQGAALGNNTLGAANSSTNVVTN